MPAGSIWKLHVPYAIGAWDATDLMVNDSTASGSGNIHCCQFNTYVNSSTSVLFAIIRLDTSNSASLPTLNASERGSVVRHEFGHIWGLGHNNCSAAEAGVMVITSRCSAYYTFNPGTDEVAWVNNNY
jgi:hypothetical protein